MDRSCEFETGNGCGKLSYFSATGLQLVSQARNSISAPFRTCYNPEPSWDADDESAKTSHLVGPKKAVCFGRL